MEKIVLSKVDEVIYKEVLDNGLTVFLYRKPDYQNKYAYFQTKYGSTNNSFVPLGKDKITNYPLGIAHFLEHKLFESSDESSVFQKLENYGAYVNAATSYDKTFYYFYTVDHFDKCLNILLDFVQSPCFTDENVNKEKGIIGQEIDMCNDNPNEFLYQKLTENVLVKSPYKDDIAGSKEEIAKITKEDLYDCYNTFYNPSNMFLTVAGDIDVEETLKLIKENQSKKHFEKQNKIIQEKVLEPSNVSIKKNVYTHNVSNEKLGYCFKTNYNKMAGREKCIFFKYISMYLEVLFGEASGFSNYLIDNKIVNSYFNYDYNLLDGDNNTLLIYILCDPIDKEKLNKIIFDKFNKIEDYKKIFELYKKNYLAGYIRRFEVIESVIGLIRTSYLKYNELFEDYYEIINSLNYGDFIETIKKINFENYVTVLLKPKGN